MHVPRRTFFKALFGWGGVLQSQSTPLTDAERRAFQIAVVDDLERFRSLVVRHRPRTGGSLLNLIDLALSNLRQAPDRFLRFSPTGEPMRAEPSSGAFIANNVFVRAALERERRFLVGHEIHHLGSDVRVQAATMTAAYDRAKAHVRTTLLRGDPFASEAIRNDIKLVAAIWLWAETKAILGSLELAILDANGSPEKAFENLSTLAKASLDPELRQLFARQAQWVKGPIALNEILLTTFQLMPDRILFEMLVEVARYEKVDLRNPAGAKWLLEALVPRFPTPFR